MKTLAAWRDAEKKNHLDTLEAMRRGMERDLQKLSEEYQQTIHRLEEDVVRQSTEQGGNGYDQQEVGVSEEVQMARAEKTSVAASSGGRLSGADLENMGLENLRSEYLALCVEYEQRVIELRASNAEKRDLCSAYNELKGSVADREKTAEAEYAMTISDLHRRLSEADDLLLNEQSSTRAAVSGRRRNVYPRMD